MSTIHKYESGIHTETWHTGSSGPYRDLAGMGDSPSPAWLARRGWYYVADCPTSPAKDYVWQPGDPAYILANGASVPQGEWVAAPDPLAGLEDLAYTVWTLLQRAGYTTFPTTVSEALAQAQERLGTVTLEETQAGLLLKSARDEWCEYAAWMDVKTIADREGWTL